MHPRHEFVLDLATVDASLLPLVGGKAANLGELIGGGFPVPPGFCVTTHAYTAVAEAVEVDTEVPARTRKAIVAAPVPAAVTEAITTAYTGLGDQVRVAVRSSATAEDLPDASFAGQQDTYLNVAGAEAVLDAVRRCWASLWTDRAVAYRSTNSIDHHMVRLAVVVQRMVDAQAAGVLFTASPVTGTRGHTVIDASLGLGESVVSGAVNPDHFVVDDTNRIIQRRLGDKTIEIHGVPGGGTERYTHAEANTRPSLTDGQIQALAELGRRVQAHYGAPQDIEWAIDGAGIPWLTQARPITTLYPLPEPERPGRVYLCVGLAQGLVRPFTPMGTSAFRVIGSVGAHHLLGRPVGDARTGPPAFVTAGLRLFLDITPAVRSRPGRVLLPKVLNVMETRSAAVLRTLFQRPEFTETTSSWLAFLRIVARVARMFRVPALMAKSVISPAAGRRHVDRIAERLRATMAVPEHVDTSQRLRHVERMLAEVFPILPSVAPVAGAGFVMLAVARRLASAELDAEQVHELMRSLPHNVTTEMDLELWALAARVGRDPEARGVLLSATAAELAARFGAGELPTVIQAGLAEFLRRHGHRAVAEIDLGVPRWSDDPTYVFGVLANYLRLPLGERPELAPDAQFERGARTAQSTVDKVVIAVRRRSRMRAAAVRFALGRVRALAGMRETHKDLLVRVLAAARAQLTLIGSDLAAANALSAPDDVFFLDLIELGDVIGGVDLTDLVARRRTEYDREMRRRHVPRLLLSDGTEPEAVATGTPTEGALVGTPASAGTVTAAARVVLDPDDAHLEPGEILVAPSTDPGWTPLFLTAGGLVMEMGGPNSHGAVVAREYGIPAVVGVPGATHRITTGQPITVDGLAGTVTPRT
ncbi:MAG: phosphoenolpyruvate synthase [Kutzneria sp.]|nr:phosphoenolpyruvate synthase [Kutzneria sp.]